MFTWTPIEGLPHPPKHFIDRAITIANEGKEKHKNITTGYYPGGAETHVDRTVVLEGEQYSSRYQVGYEIGEDFNQWVRDHIVEDAFDELFTAGTKLKGRVQVEFITDQGSS